MVNIDETAGRSPARRAFIDSDRRQYCWSHLARDFTALAERPRRVGKLGRELVAASAAMFATWHTEREAGRRPDWSRSPMAAHHDRITNNAAERALRNRVIWRTLSFGTRSEAGTCFVERPLSVRETCRLQGRSLHQFLVETITAQLQGSPMPALLPLRASRLIAVGSPRDTASMC